MIPGGVLALLVVIGSFGGGEEAPSSAPAPETSSTPAPRATTPEPEPSAAPVEVSAGTLLEDFEGNELAADRTYEGKTLRVTGVVDKIDTELFDDDQYVLRIGSGRDFAFLTVNCNDMDSDELLTLEAGEDVTVVGEFDDGGDLGVELQGCRLA